MTRPSLRALRPMLGDPRQFAGVRRIVLDDGPERGVRALAFSTGGGLDFWAVIDRSLDIGTLSWRGTQIGWQSPACFRAPSLLSPDSDGGFGFGRGFGGFLVTCGLDHIRQPRNGRPLHGHLPHTPARLLAYGEDWEASKPVIYCEGELHQWRYGAETFLLRRRIEAPIGGSSIHISDRIENIGPEPCPLALLYHFNLGYPGIAAGTTVTLNDQLLLGLPRFPDQTPVPEASVYPSAGTDIAHCVVTTPTEGAGFREVHFRWPSQALPYLQLWRDLRPNYGVLSIEPCNSGRLRDGSNEPLSMLLPGERTTFTLDLAISDVA